MASSGKSLKHLRRMCAYARYKATTGEDDAAAADHASLMFAIGIILALKDHDPDLYIEMIAKGRDRLIRIENTAPLDPPRVYTPRRLRDYAKELDRRGNRPAADTARVLAELIQP